MSAMTAEDRAAESLDIVPDAVLALRERQTIARLRATRPGRHSRRLYTLAMEGALSDGAELRRAVRGILAPLATRPWMIDPPDAAALRKLNQVHGPRAKRTT